MIESVAVLYCRRLDATPRGTLDVDDADASLWPPFSPHWPHFSNATSFPGHGFLPLDRIAHRMELCCDVFLYVYKCALYGIQHVPQSCLRLQSRGVFEPIRPLELLLFLLSAACNCRRQSTWVNKGHHPRHIVLPVWAFELGLPILCEMNMIIRGQITS